MQKKGFRTHLLKTINKGAKLIKAKVVVVMNLPV
jgi:hypothetical protein